MRLSLRKSNPLPGFGMTLGYTLFYLGLIVLIPLSALMWKAANMTWHDFWQTVSRPVVVASFKLTFGASLIAALVNAVFGFILAWTLVRYRFVGKRIVDAAVDLPFALPTAVSGIALASIYSKNGWIGRYLEQMGIHVVHHPLGIVIALTFIGLPFVVRTVQPALADLDREMEEASASLGATRLQTFAKVIIPTILPALLTGFSMAFARAIGEYGSVVFIAGNRPFKTQIASLQIMTQLEAHHYAEATAIAAVMLIASFAMLLSINALQWWSSQRQRGAA